MEIAIIGAGAAGLAAAAALTKTHNVMVFEQSKDLGGLWQAQVDFENTALYPSLRTNLPAALMAFLDFPFDPKLIPPELGDYPGPKAVADYLKAFSEEKCLQPLIKFDHKVTSVTRHSSGWLIKFNAHTPLTADAIVVCNGHYTTPNLPLIAGLEHLANPPRHAKHYVEPGDFAGQRVVVWGSNASGIDLVREISPQARAVFWCGHSDERSAFVSDLENVSICADLEAVTSDGIVLRDKQLLTGIDEVLFCTGYQYDFPFLDSEIIKTEAHRVQGLYQQILAIQQPNLAFIGLPYLVVPFPLFQIQSQWLAKVFSGDVDLSRMAKRQKTPRETSQRPPERSELDRGFHRLGDQQIGYLTNLIDEANLTDLPLNFIQMLKAAQRIKQRNPCHYRDIRLDLQDPAGPPLA